VGPYAVEPVGACQVRDDMLQTGKSFLTCDKTPFYTHENGHHPKAGTPQGDHFLVVSGIDTIEVDTFPRHP